MAATTFHKALCCVPLLGDLVAYQTEKELESAIDSWIKKGDAASSYFQVTELVQLRAEYSAIEKVRSIAAAALSLLGSCNGTLDPYIGGIATGVYLLQALRETHHQIVLIPRP